MRDMDPKWLEFAPGSLHYKYSPPPPSLLAIPGRTYAVDVQYTKEAETDYLDAAYTYIGLVCRSHTHNPLAILSIVGVATPD